MVGADRAGSLVSSDSPACRTPSLWGDGVLPRLPCMVVSVERDRSDSRRPAWKTLSAWVGGRTLVALVLLGLLFMGCTLHQDRTERSEERRVGHGGGARRAGGRVGGR